MEIGRIKGATRVLGKSQGYYGLPIRDEAKNLGDLPHMLLTLQNDSVTGPDTPTMVTAWLPSPDELAALAGGAPIYVSLVGMAHPPIMVSVGDAPEQTPTLQQHSLIRSVAGGFRCLRCDQMFDDPSTAGICRWEPPK